MTVKAIDDLALAGKRVLVRVDYNVPLDEDGRITNDTRIRASLPTLAKLRAAGAQLTLMSHLGRPKGKPNPVYSLKPVAEHLGQILGLEVPLITDLDTPEQHAEVQILENLRFDAGETGNDPAFAAKLAAFGEVYVNDAFGAAHRAHASIDAVTKHFAQKGAGDLLQKELHYLHEALKEPERPFLAILGGSKISDKLKLIKNLLPKVDQLMIGGGMSYTFLKAQDIAIGHSLVEEDFLDSARELIQLCNDQNVELLLPLDHLTAPEFKETAQPTTTDGQAIADGTMGLDIGPKSVTRFVAAIQAAKTVVWNGPMGVFEWDAFSRGTLAVAEALAASTGLSVIGGGDSVAAAHKAGVQDQITHISTGGGASLELLGGNILPGVAALEAE